jgi:hypothetical protein
LRRFALALIASQKRSLSTAAIIAISASGAFAAQAPATDCHGSLPETFVREAALKIVGDLRNELSQGKELSPGVGRIFLDRLHSVLKKRLDEIWITIPLGQRRNIQYWGPPRFLEEYNEEPQALICFPELAALVKEQRQIIAVAEAAKQAAEQKAQAERAAENAKPHNRLYIAYQRWVYIQFCNEVRQGYLVTYVNDIERERARVAVKAIEKAALAEQADLDTDAIWTLARKAMVGKHAYQEQCRVELEALLRNSPVPTYDIRKP